MIHNLSIKKRHVNSKSLFNEINEFIETGLLTQGISWDVLIHRDSLIEVITDWMDEFVKEDKITQFNVIADDRNNPSNQPKDQFNVRITYKQKHCLNVTSIEYTVTDVEDFSEDLIDWILYP